MKRLASRLVLLAAALGGAPAGHAQPQSLVFCRPPAGRVTLAPSCDSEPSALSPKASAPEQSQPLPPGRRDLGLARRDSELFVRPFRPHEFFPEESRILMQNSADKSVDFMMGVRVPY